EVAAREAVARREGAREFAVQGVAGGVREVSAAVDPADQGQGVIVIGQAGVVERQDGPARDEGEAAGGVVDGPEVAPQAEVVRRQVARLHGGGQNVLAERDGNLRGRGRQEGPAGGRGGDDLEGRVHHRVASNPEHVFSGGRGRGGGGDLDVIDPAGAGRHGVG